MAIIGISSIHLLKTFIAAGTLNGLPFCPPELVATAASNIGEGRCTALTTEGVMWQTIIHIVFILSAIGIAWTDRLMPAGNGKGKSAH